MNKAEIPFARTYGKRVRLGLIVPPTNSTNEAEFWERSPQDVSIVTTRMDLHLPDQDDNFCKHMISDLDKACTDLISAEADICIYACTAGSMVMDKEKLGTTMAKHGRPYVHTAEALLDTFRKMGISTVAVATPYTSAINAHEKDYLQSSGVEVVNITGLGIGETPDEYRLLSQIPAEVIFNHARNADRPDADAVFISCTDLAASSVIGDLERELDKPVLTSNQVTLWAALRKLGIDDVLTKYGRLWNF